MHNLCQRTHHVSNILLTNALEIGRTDSWFLLNSKIKKMLFNNFVQVLV